MKTLNELYQSDDWKTEKHVPVIEAPDTVSKNQPFTVSAMIGKEIEHPNTVPHHIRWIQLFFLPDEKKIPIEIGSFEFTAHGDQNPDEERGIYSSPSIAASIRIDGPGTLMASAYCNIHGLWQSSKTITCE
ncbi:MAG: Neelaredoxin [Spartobacteria bacterium]|nr:Neelaredoxin [Spartobacteria bacterium]